MCVCVRKRNRDRETQRDAHTETETERQRQNEREGRRKGEQNRGRKVGLGHVLFWGRQRADTARHEPRVGLGIPEERPLFRFYLVATSFDYYVIRMLSRKSENMASGTGMIDLSGS